MEVWDLVIIMTQDLMEPTTEISKFSYYIGQSELTNILDQIPLEITRELSGESTIIVVIEDYLTKQSFCKFSLNQEYWEATRVIIEYLSEKTRPSVESRRSFEAHYDMGMGTIDEFMRQFYSNGDSASYRNMNSFCGNIDDSSKEVPLMVEKSSIDSNTSEIQKEGSRELKVAYGLEKASIDLLKIPSERKIP